MPSGSTTCDEQRAPLRPLEDPHEACSQSPVKRRRPSTTDLEACGAPVPLGRLGAKAAPAPKAEPAATPGVAHVARMLPAVARATSTTLGLPGDPTSRTPKSTRVLPRAQGAGPTTPGTPAPTTPPSYGDAPCRPGGASEDEDVEEGDEGGTSTETSDTTEPRLGSGAGACASRNTSGESCSTAARQGDGDLSRQVSLAPVAPTREQSPAPLHEPSPIAAQVDEVLGLRHPTVPSAVTPPRPSSPASDLITSVPRSPPGSPSAGASPLGLLLSPGAGSHASSLPCSPPACALPSDDAIPLTSAAAAYESAASGPEWDAEALLEAALAATADPDGDPRAWRAVLRASRLASSPRAPRDIGHPRRIGAGPANGSGPEPDERDPEAAASLPSPHPPRSSSVDLPLPPPESLPSLPDSALEYDPFPFLASLPPRDDVPPGALICGLPSPLLPRRTRRCPPKTLVLDLDETLVHSSLDRVVGSDFSFRVDLGATSHVVGVRRRPHLAHFLQAVSARFEVVVFTASQRVYAERLLDVVDPGRRLVRHRLFRDACVLVGGCYVKDLSALGRDLANTLIVDNSPQAFGFHLDNGVPIESWYDDDDDDALLRLLPFLDQLAEAPDVRPAIAQRFGLSRLVETARGRGVGVWGLALGADA